MKDFSLDFLFSFLKHLCRICTFMSFVTMLDLPILLLTTNNFFFQAHVGLLFNEITF